MENPAAAFLADAIRDHRETHDDDALYLALITYETYIDHGGAQDDFLEQATAYVR